MDTVLSALLGLAVVAAVAYFNDQKVFSNRNNIPLFVLAFVLTLVLVIFGSENVFMFVSVLGIWHISTMVIKAVSKPPTPMTAMRSSSGGFTDNGKDEKTLEWIVRLVVAVIAILFIYFGYFKSIPCEVGSEDLYCRLHSGSILPHIGGIMFLVMCGFFILIWKTSIKEKLLGVNSSWPAILAFAFGVVGISFIYI